MRLNKIKSATNFVNGEFKNQSINAIIGSSMGGFAGYYLAKSLGVRAMLYNPALPYRTSIEQFVPDRQINFYDLKSHQKQLGAKF